MATLEEARKHSDDDRTDALVREIDRLGEALLVAQKEIVRLEKCRVVEETAYAQSLAILNAQIANYAAEQLRLREQIAKAYIPPV